MNIVHLHLRLTHVPVVGRFALVLLGVAVLRRSNELKNTGPRVASPARHRTALDWRRDAQAVGSDLTT